MSIIKLNLKPDVETRSQAMGLLINPGDGVLVKRGQPRWLLLKCPCGCGDEIPVNLDARAGKAWRVYEGPKQQITIYPSVWRDTGCKSHFILWRNKIDLFGRYGEEEIASERLDLDSIAIRSLSYLSLKGNAHFADVADAIGEIPWDVLDACRLLARRGKLVEASGPSRGTFFVPRI